MHSDMGLRAGMRLGGRYRLEDRLGAGGMGEVWRAVDESLGRSVAVKTMLPAAAADPDFVRRFAAEATVMARVNHPAVASIHDFVRADGVTFLVMEFVDGESLAQRLRRDGRLDAAETIRIVAQAAEGLQAVHDQGIVHRDIKPANMLLRRDGSVVITDFGIARHEDASRVTASGAILGTPSYLSPEQVLGQPVDRRSDVYALGLVAYECLAGERPFVGDNPYAVALQRVQQAPKTIGVTVPPTVLALVERALAVDPERRFPSALSFAEAARHVSLTAAPASSETKRPERKKVLAGVLAVLVAAAVVTGIALQRDKAKSPAVAAPKASASATARVPAGFQACGEVLCPTAPMCWNGLTAISQVASPPVSAFCPGSHIWETFLAIPLPAGPPPKVSEDAPLIKRPEYAKACSHTTIGKHSLKPKATKNWLIELWPIETDGVWLLHCLAQPKAHVSTGSAYKA
ncbi:hypothetical protein GCM10010168_29110 [Actinoplanes ianthinogenes]|uniref:non-specific serine/threonine protein kinase n=1 Tax=Actinoplanes ianthinogenes TaxID=122358 RepID=A0ABM7LLL6_9ACTN|nr:serine/threonine-protein kinase [Actinoplanes ianthinogenes]BCJ40053.1 hypothetical protein Aiant_07100 [Actinoplanes ianthinogenes]GGR09954.1 hypothetical protein GCM10010168_29110 [Actinoplanes ianthinogenes]